VVSFNVAAEAYDAFMGRWSRLLSGKLADLADVHAGQRALDVGCGTGALTSELVARLGHEQVSAVDPSEPFVAAMRVRFPSMDVRQAPAEALPYADGAFDVALSQLVIHFMEDPVAGLREMGRVTRHGGLVAASVWDHAGQRGPLRDFWEAARAIDPDVDDESERAGTREGHLADLFGQAGISGIESIALTVELSHPTFEDWWEPFEHGVGPAGAFVAGLDSTQHAALRSECLRRLSDGPVVISAVAWAARGRP
jgi:SAM-dependent methyltransferase